jgi:hypothetical protein
MKKIVKKITAAAAFIIIVSAALYFVYQFFFNPRRGEADLIEDSMPLSEVLSRDEALKDIEYLYQKLKYHHPAWLETNINVEKINSMFTSYRKELPNTITTVQLWRDVSFILSVLHDGHTMLLWNNPGEELYIDDFTIPSLYSNPVKINYQNIEDILSEYLKLTSYEYDFYAMRRFFDSAIYTKSSLDFLGVDTSTGVTYTYLEDGKPVNFYFEFVPYEQAKKENSEVQDTTWVWYSIDEEQSLGIFTLTSCDLNEEYYSVLSAFFNEVHEKSIKNVAVDLRGNGGGHSGVANAFLQYINVDTYVSWDSSVRYGPLLWKNENIVVNNLKKDPVFSGELYVITNVYSYSSAMDFAMLIKDNNLGHIIGEPSGNSPDSYGDNLYFQMPNSKLYFTVSHKKWYRVNKDKAGLPIEPDYECASADAVETLYKIISKN